MPRNRTLDSQKVLLWINRNNLQILSSETFITIMPRHLLPLEHMRRTRRCSHRTRRTPAVRLTMSFRAATKAMTLYGASKTTTFCLPGHINVVSGRKLLHSQNLPNFIIGRVLRAELAQMTHRGYTNVLFTLGMLFVSF